MVHPQPEATAKKILSKLLDKAYSCQELVPCHTISSFSLRHLLGHPHFAKAQPQYLTDLHQYPV